MLGILVLGLEYRLDDVGISLGILADYRCRAVGGGVVVDDGLEAEAGALHHEAFQTVADIGLVVVCQTADGDRQRLLAALGIFLHKNVFTCFLLYVCVVPVPSGLV